MTAGDLVEIGSWKTKNRQRHNLMLNSEELVREVTELALARETGRGAEVAMNVQPDATRRSRRRPPLLVSHR